MTDALLWILTPFLAYALARVVIAAWHRKGPVRERSEEHEALLAAWTEWLVDPVIATALMRYHSGPRLRAFRNRMADMDEDVLRHEISELLAPRHLRREIADRVASIHRLPRAEVLRGLLEWKEASA